MLRDRLYLNEGGKFALAESSAMPIAFHSGSVVSAADFDHDGDLDLFVGSRVIPGAYPRSPSSQLLENQGGKFIDVIDQRAASLKDAGMVTSACWTDVDSDGWSDLMVAYEWGPVRCFLNHNGSLTDATESAGLAQNSGWWNGIASGDVDHDGDLDFVVTNFGLNTKYHAATDHPVRIYYGDFDGSGKHHIVESEFEGSKLFPVRGKSCSTNAIPILAERFKTFSDFGVAELNDVYTESCLAEALRFEANTLENGVLLNDGSGRFSFRPLPRIAQIAPAFGASLMDVNLDGHLDLYLTQNFYGPQRETGQMDGGVSLLLTGDGNGNWSPVWPNKSNLIVGGDAKSLVSADLNGDGFSDFLVGVNNAALQGFGVAMGSAQRVLRVRLRGRAGNPTAMGARISMHGGDGKNLQLCEFASTSGYLSQCSSETSFAIEPDARNVRLTITWPGGATSHESVDLGAQQVIRKTFAYRE